MSEINDIVQIADLVFRIGRGVTLAAIKVYTTAYYSQWYGQASLQKFHKLVGSHTGYLDIATQDPAVLKQTLSMMDRYGILYAKLPDLNTSDGRTQIVFNSDQTESLKAALNDYNAQKLKLLQTSKEKLGENTDRYMYEKAKIEKQMPAIRSMTADNYALTRLDASGHETTEYTKLKASAEKNIRKREAKSKLPSDSDDHTLAEKAASLKKSSGKTYYLDALKKGNAQKITMAADMTEEFFPNKTGKLEKVFRARFPQGEYSVLLKPEQVLNARSAIVTNSEKLPIISNKGKTSVMAGRKVAEVFSAKVPSLSVQATLAAAKIAKKTASDVKKATEQTQERTRKR